MGGGKIDLNPMHSSLFTGAGLPWGAMKTGDPGDMPSVPGARSIDEFQAFDQSEIVKRLIGQLRGQGAKQTQGALRQASRMGAAQSDAARKQVGNIAADVADRAAGVELQAAKDAWEDRMRQKQFAEQMDMNRYNQALAQWQAKKQAYNQEDAGRKKGLLDIATLGASALFG